MNTCRYIISIGLAIAIAVAVQAQGIVVPTVQEQPSKSRYPIAGSHLLRKQEAKVVEYLKSHPEELQVQGMRKTQAWGFSVGSTHSWYAVNFITSSNYSVPSTCRAVGTSCYIFVEDASWTSGSVTQAAVDSVRIAFDQRTPANAGKGIYQTDVDAFGNPPNIDGDPLIVILILDIKDTYSQTQSGGYVAGYYYSLNETTQFQSNRAEILYIDCNPVNLTLSWGIEQAMSTTAHEFQHMIHFNYIHDQETFINEGWSLVAEVNAGYPLYDQSGFINNPNRYLFDWSDNNTAVLSDYSRAARFSVYLRDQFTMSIFKNVLASRTAGIDGINTGLQRSGTALRFIEVLKNWLMANIVNDRTIDTTMGYLYKNVPKVVPKAFYNPNVSLKTDTVQNLAAEYLAFKSGSNLHVTFTTPAGSSLIIKALEIGSSSERIVDVTPGVQFIETGFGSTYTEIDFIISNADLNTPQLFTYKSSGSSVAIEQRWDNTEPVGYLGLDPGDTIAVTFDAVPGARLDSIRVAVRRAGTLNGGVYRYATEGTSILGKMLVPISGSISTTPSYPYAVPYPNWITYDLRSSLISGDSAFIVAFPVVGDYQTEERIMVTTYPSATGYHSYVYLTNPTGNNPGWFVLSEGQDTVWIFLVRSYLSFVASVYPGDANNDSIVDVRDILPLGLYYGKTGTPRANASTEWKPQFIDQPWTPEQAGYADCDGNGVVDSNDVLPIIQNWYATKSGGVPSGILRSTVCEELLKEIDRNGASGPMRSIRNAVASYLKQAKNEPVANVPADFELSQNFPNPFNPSTVIRFSLPKKMDKLRFSVFNILGQLIWEKVVRDAEPGRHEIRWAGETSGGSKVGSGIYFYRMTAGSFTDIKKMIFIK